MRIANSNIMMTGNRHFVQSGAPLASVGRYGAAPVRTGTGSSAQAMTFAQTASRVSMAQQTDAADGNGTENASAVNGSPLSGSGMTGGINGLTGMVNSLSAGGIQSALLRELLQRFLQAGMVFGNAPGMNSQHFTGGISEFTGGSFSFPAGMRSTLPGFGSAGFGSNAAGFTFNQTTYYEEESTSFSATGCALTEDGRRIDFDVAIEMSRSFMQYTQVHIPSLTNALLDPLMINLDTASVHLSDQKFKFDLDCDGTEDEISMAGKGTGFLALDKNEDGIINDGSELFGTASGDGFKDLAEYDRDGNGWIDENDDIFEKLKVWVKDDTGKDVLMNLKEADIGAIYLGAEDTDFSLTGADMRLNGMVRRTGLFLRESGSAGTMQHVDLALGSGEDPLTATVEGGSVQNIPGAMMIRFDGEIPMHEIGGSGNGNDAVPSSEEVTVSSASGDETQAKTDEAAQNSQDKKAAALKRRRELQAEKQAMLEKLQAKKALRRDQLEALFADRAEQREKLEEAFLARQQERDELNEALIAEKQAEALLEKHAAALSEARAGTQTDTNPETQTDANPETQTEANPETQTEANPGTQADAKTTTLTGANPETPTGTHPEIQAA